MACLSNVCFPVSSLACKRDPPVPAIAPPSHRFKIDLHLSGNAAGTAALDGFQDDMGSFDQSLSTCGAVGYLRQYILL